MTQSPKLSGWYGLLLLLLLITLPAVALLVPQEVDAPGLVRDDGLARRADGAHREGRHRVLAGGPHR